jgi:hypothetical protein
MFKGKIIATVAREDATREGIGLLMAGIVEQQAAAVGEKE